MNIDGARELARRLEARHGRRPEAEPRARLKAVDAPPLFHWLGVEPPAGRRADDSLISEPRQRSFAWALGGRRR